MTVYVLQPAARGSAIQGSNAVRNATLAKVTQTSVARTPATTKTKPKDTSTAMPAAVVNGTNITRAGQYQATPYLASPAMSGSEAGRVNSFVNSTHYDVLLPIGGAVGGCVLSGVKLIELGPYAALFGCALGVKPGYEIGEKASQAVDGVRGFLMIMSGDNSTVY